MTAAVAPGDIEDADLLLSAPWPPNGGYYPADQIIFKQCARCGIVMRLKEQGRYQKRSRTWCRDCNYPEFRAPLEGAWKW